MTQLPIWAAHGVNTIQLCGLRMEESIPGTETGVLVPGKVGMDGCETEQPTDVDYKALQCIKHQAHTSGRA